MTTPFEVFKDREVTDVKTVAEFLDRYRKKDRYTDRGEGYAADVLASSEASFEMWGVCWISKFGSITGEVVAFYGSETEDD